MTLIHLIVNLNSNMIILKVTPLGYFKISLVYLNSNMIILKGNEKKSKWRK